MQGHAAMPAGAGVAMKLAGDKLDRGDSRAGRQDSLLGTAPQFSRSFSYVEGPVAGKFLILGTSQKGSNCLEHIEATSVNVSQCHIMYIRKQLPSMVDYIFLLLLSEPCFEKTRHHLNNAAHQAQMVRLLHTQIVVPFCRVSSEQCNAHSFSHKHRPWRGPLLPPLPSIPSLPPLLPLVCYRLTPIIVQSAVCHVCVTFWSDCQKPPAFPPVKRREHLVIC